MGALNLSAAERPNAMERPNATETPQKELAAGCPMTELLERLTRPWTLHLLWLFSSHGPMRFGALRRRAEGISARVLTVRLRTLEHEGFVHRTVRAGKVPEVIYTPTSRLEDMHEFMADLHRMSEKWQGEDQTEGKKGTAQALPSPVVVEAAV